ncbi:hypothetical protein [Streptomyces sp. NPDC048442]|uniref:hypothetical protein n=1 Tax=Streptomyces sp. NPDC048442 TaxID=3154823 RepID=UPI00343931CD
MTSFVNRYLTEVGTTVSTLSAWDGRPTSALVHQLDVSQIELFWLVWDLAPRYEIWLRVPVEQWQTKELLDPDLLISDFVARHADGSAAVVEVFDPTSGARPSILLTTTMKIHGAAENLAALIAGQARKALETRSEPVPPALADFAELAADLADAQ